MQEVFNRTKYLYDGKYIVGFGVGGVEEDNDLKKYEKIFNEAFDLKIPLTVHAGENGSVKNLEYCIDHPGIKRIGHALSYNKLENNKKLELKNSGKLVEILLTSNKRLNYISSLQEHPVINMNKDGINYCISTDDVTIFQTKYSYELEIIKNLLGLTKEDIKKMNKNAVENSFCDERTKAILKETL